MDKKIQKKRFWSIFILEFISWASLSGQFMDIYEGKLNSEWMLPCFLYFLGVNFIMMLVPLILFLKNGDRLENSYGKKVCKWNSIILLLISIILGLSVYKGVMLIGGLGALMFYYINKWLYVYYKDEPKKKYKNKSENIAFEKNKKEKYEYKIIDDEDLQITENNKKIKTKYCKLCGGKLDQNKKCKKCGKQYFHFKKTNITTIVLMILLILSITLNILVLLDNKDKKMLMDTCIKDKFDNENDCVDALSENMIEYLDLSEKADFLDKNIVFVLEGYGNKYYTYDCVKKITNGEEYSYWAYNKEAAKSNGYKKGTCN